MEFKLITSVPAWFILLCFVSGIAATYLLYYFRQKTTLTDIFKFPVIIQAILRFFGFSILTFFLLSPIIRYRFRQLEKPVIIILNDRSKSVVSGKDSNSYKNAFLPELESLKKKLSKKFKTEVYSFGKKVESGIDSKPQSRTDLANALNYVYDHYSGMNIGAVIIASDGINNSGADPLLAANNINSLIYTIALGDTTIKKDLLISEINYPSVIYPGNSFMVNTTVKAKKAQGTNLNISLLKDGQIIDKQSVQSNSENFLGEIRFEVSPQKAGIHKYVLKIDPVNGEISYLNNSKEIYIEVLDNKKKVLMIAGNPHPDIGAIKRSLENSVEFEVDVKLLSEFQSTAGNSIKSYDIVIMHQVPSKTRQSKQLMSDFLESKVPAWFILGSQSDLYQFNQLGTGFSINQKKGLVNDALPVFQTQFDYFSLSENATRIISELPPLVVPFGEFRTTVESQSIFNQKIGSVVSSNPLMTFLQNSERRIVVTCGEGLWRWPLIESSISQNKNFFDELVGKTIRFLSVKENKAYFRLKNFERVKYDDEPVLFEAELFDKNYEFLKNAEIKLIITSQDGKEFRNTFREQDGLYVLDAGYLPPGNYSYKATAVSGSQTHQLSGIFTIKPVDFEFIDLTANHNLLYTIAKEKGGKMVPPQNTSELYNEIINSSQIKPVAFYQQENRDLIEMKWIFFLLIAIFGTEWFLRNFFGGY